MKSITYPLNILSIILEIAPDIIIKRALSSRASLELIIKYFFLIFIITSLFLSSSSKVRKSAGVTRKSLDEFQVVENPPLVIPPDFNLLPPEQLEKKNIDDV